MKRLLLITFYLILFSFTAPAQQKQNEFLSGADLLLKEKSNMLAGKNIGVLTNHTALLKNGMHLIDSLSHIKDLTIKRLFSPEHGIRGKIEAGAKVGEETDIKTGLKVISLYGKNYKPKKEELEGLDFLLFDLQDVGTRYFTYISTLYHAMEACAENNVPLIVLDRPNPIAPIKTDGPLTEKKFESFISIAPIPIIHGMTIGELARYFNSLLKERNGIECRLTVIPLKNWNRNRFFDSYYENWIKPSPNMSDLETAIIYPGTCLIEGTNISEGRGTNSPFLTIGAPFINSALLIKELKRLKTEGISVSPMQFTPQDIPGVATNTKYKNETCSGIKIKITDRKKAEPLKFGIKLLYALHKLFPDFRFKDKTIDTLFGSDYLRNLIINDSKPEKIFLKGQKELNNFINLKKQFLLY
jgi:uncharacterized protein YbbC (DUF1343 family)